MIGQQLTFDAAPDELNLFMSEGEEQLEILSRDILRLEHEGDTNSELLQEIFRAAHTLKGSSGVIGHQRMARLTHALETVLDHVRQHKLSISTQLIDLLLKGLDALRVLLEEVSTCVESDVTIDDLCTALIALANSQSAAAPVVAATPPPVAAQPVVVATPQVTLEVPTEMPVWHVVTKIDDTCALPAARALQIILAASLAGTVVTSQPTQAEVEALKVEAGAQIAFTLTSAHPDAETDMLVRKAIGRIAEVSIVSITSPTGATGSVGAPVTAVEEEGVAATWHIAASIDSGCLLPAVRALQVILATSVVGTIVACNPTREDVEAGNVAIGATIALQIAMPASESDAETHLRAVIGRISEVTVTSITSPAGVMSAIAAQPAKPKPLPTAKVDAAELASVMATQPQPQPVVTPAPTPPAPIAMTRNAEQHPEGAEPPRPLAATHAPRMVRIDVERLDALMNLVGELVIDRTRLARITAKVGAHTDDQNIVEELTETCRHLARISDDLQDEVMRSRMLPIESVFSKFPRLVRDLAQRVNKKIDFVVEGKDTELDRSVAEQISDPIIHLLRNSIDHGIEVEENRRRDGKPEVGQVRLSARHEENQIVIDIEDDGKGINPEFLKNKAISRGLITAEAAARMSNREATELIFASGFSTAEQVSDISGRGVGMDIVRTNVERLNGTITVETEVGQGTRFTVRLPLTLAIIRALLVDVGGQTYAIPLTSVVEALRIEKNELRSVNGREAIELRGQVLPLLRLADIFRAISKDLYANTTSDAEATRQFVVAVRWGERRGGLIVDSLIGEQEIVIKSLGQLFRGAHGISGGAVLGDGQVAPILDIAALIKHIIAEEHGIQAQGISA